MVGYLVEVKTVDGRWTISVYAEARDELHAVDLVESKLKALPAGMAFGFVIGEARVLS